MNFDSAYATTPALFGVGPDQLLIDHVQLLDPGRPVLDLGAGQGRHALWLGRQGFRVHAVDLSAEAMGQLQQGAIAEGLPLTTEVGGFEAVQRPPNGYGTVLVFGLVPILSRDQIAMLVTALGDLVAPGGVALVTAFTTEDPRFGERSDAWPRVGVRSHRSPSGLTWTWMAPDELVALFSDDFEVLHHREGLGPWHRHGDGEPECHGMAEVVLRRVVGAGPFGRRR